MGKHKHEMQLAEDNWKQGGPKCAVCAQSIPIEERDTYFAQGMCDFCRHMAEKDD